MLKKLLIMGAGFLTVLQLQGGGTGEIPVCTYDKLSNEGLSRSIEVLRPLKQSEAEYLAGRQALLCMIGDSVTWAQAGDHFRCEFLKLFPQLAFVGTHTGILGYSHAGEGGDSSRRLLTRVDDPERIPDAPYYHLLIGVNDAGGAKKDEQSEKVASATVERIVTIVNKLLQRKGTRKLFLGSILPSPFGPNGESTVRERTGSLINAKLRRDFKKFFPSGKVVWIEYEKPLRARLNTWKKRENLRGAHPTAAGYKILASIAVPVLKREMETTAGSAGKGKIGVGVTNLWHEEKNLSAPLLPGWYILSMTLDKCSEAEFELVSQPTPAKKQFKKRYHLKGKANSRVEVEFMTGYQGYHYDRAPFEIKLSQGSISQVQIEKMRPLKRASVYGKGHFIDTVSPCAAGEVLQFQGRKGQK